MAAEHQHSDLFRKEAVEYHIAEHRRPGDVLRISPGWISWLSWLLLALFVVGILYVTLEQMPEYAEGPAVIWVEDRIDVPARRSGTVERVTVRPGQRVEADTPVVHLYNAEERAEYDRIRQAFDLQLINSLRDPLDVVARQELTTLRALREQGWARLQECCVRAPEAGVVCDIRIRNGQPVSPGDVLLSLKHDKAKLKVIALLPGRHRPLLKERMELRLELTGYRYAYQKLTIVSVGEAVLGPAAAQRYLGREMADAVLFTGPVVLVHADLKTKTFKAYGRSFEYFHGMQGTAAVRVRSASILRTLLPWLETLNKADA